MILSFLNRLIRVRSGGHTRVYLLRDVQWAPAYIALGADGLEYTIPAKNYPPPTSAQAEHFWVELEETFARKRNTEG